QDQPWREPAPVDAEVRHLPPALRLLAVRPGPGRAALRDRTLQDGDHPALRPLLAVRGVRPGGAGGRPVRGTLLLPLPLSARGRPGHPRPAAHLQLAAALPRLRQSLSAL